ncbi:MAG TPA: CYTH domain-containing protein [Kofleriaceae bacterium]|jgi:adenylate cyclase
MGAEIERKFLVDTARWQPQGQGELYVQGYLSSAKERTVRVRREGERAVITVKGPNQGVTRAEFEYPIPPADADSMLHLCEQPLIQKRRHKEKHGAHTWEIDVFEGENAGLVVAEIELSDENEVFDKPVWVGREVSDDPRYYNASLIRTPFKSWA